MNRLFKGNRYDFLVRCFKKDNLFCFYIKAISKMGKTYSYINNLNYILSNLNITVNDSRVSESQWILKDKESNYFFNKVIDLLSDKISVNYLEKQLDLDRELGEWNKIPLH